MLVLAFNVACQLVELNYQHFLSHINQIETEAKSIKIYKNTIDKYKNKIKKNYSKN